MLTDRREPVPPRPLMVSPFRDAVNALCFGPLDISDACERIVGRPGCEVGPDRLAELLAVTPERPERALRRMARQLEGGGR